MNEQFKHYTKDAAHYLFPGGLGENVNLRKQFVSFCVSKGLDQKFQELVEGDSEWRELADAGQVYFFEDTVHMPENFDLPSIFLVCTEGGTKAVIKLMLKSREEYEKYYYLED